MHQHGIGGILGVGALALLLGCEPREAEPPEALAQEVAPPAELDRPDITDNPLHLIAGRVVEVDPGLLRVQGPTGEFHALRLTLDTRILRGGETVTVDHLRPGTLVQASFRTKEGMLVAEEVLLMSAPLTAPAPEGALE